jgi:hypothetical protein
LGSCRSQYQGTRHIPESWSILHQGTCPSFHFPYLPGALLTLLCPQVLITIMASVGAGSAYAVRVNRSCSRKLLLISGIQTDIVAVQRVYYNQIHNFSCQSLCRLPRSHCTQLPTYQDQWMIVMSTQLIGFSVGGISRRFLVQPPSMSAFLSPVSQGNMSLSVHSCAVWPANLVSCAMFNTLHSQQYAGMGKRGGISRERFFFYAFLASLLYCQWSPPQGTSNLTPDRLPPRVSIPSTQCLRLGLLDRSDQHREFRKKPVLMSMVLDD